MITSSSSSDGAAVSGFSGLQAWPKVAGHFAFSVQFINYLLPPPEMASDCIVAGSQSTGNRYGVLDRGESVMTSITRC